MKKYVLVRVIEMPECGYVVIGDETRNYSVGDIVDVSDDDQVDIRQLIEDKVLEEITEEVSAPRVEKEG